jgi:hypothetical protein
MLLNTIHKVYKEVWKLHFINNESFEQTCGLLSSQNSNGPFQKICSSFFIVEANQVGVHVV